MSEKKKKVVVGLSGGVDSSIAAYVLIEQGFEVIGLFMKNWHDTTGVLKGDCPWLDDKFDAEAVARKLKFPFHMVDLSAQYRDRVVDYMFAEFEKIINELDSLPKVYLSLLRDINNDNYKEKIDLFKSEVPLSYLENILKDSNEYDGKEEELIISEEF